MTLSSDRLFLKKSRAVTQKVLCFLGYRPPSRFVGTIYLLSLLTSRQSSGIFPRMFFRTKRTPSGSVLQLLEAYRNGEGLPRQRVVVSLGNANLPKSLRRIVARAMEMKLYPQGGDLAGLEPQWSSEARHWIDSIYPRNVS